jgi:hypothetical protein
MEIFIKLSSQDYERLRRLIPAASSAREALNKATRIEHALEGVEFEGYNMPCNEEQARAILEVAKRCCPDIVRDIENAITRPRR